MKKRHLFVALLILMATPWSIAQRPDRTSGLTAKEIKDFAERAMINLNQFNEMLSFIATPHSGVNSTVKSAEEEENMIRAKDRRIKQALNLFMGKGLEYKDQYDNPHDPVQMETSSINRATGKTTIRRQDVRQYLYVMKNNKMRYTEVKITASDSYMVQDAYEVEDGVYKAVMAYMQKFEGIREGRVVYRDITEKYVEVYIYRDEIDGEVRWRVLLGDIYVNSTE